MAVAVVADIANNGDSTYYIHQQLSVLRRGIPPFIISVFKVMLPL